VITTPLDVTANAGDTLLAQRTAPLEDLRL
jgi:hypothetical protein